MSSISLVGKQKELEQSKKELKNYQRKKEYLEKLISLNELRIKYRKEINQIIRDHNKKLTPDYEYETLEDFYKLGKELARIEQEWEEYKMSQELVDLKEQLKVTIEEIERYEKRIPELEKELEELKKK